MLMIWLMSVIIGNSKAIEVKNGWLEKATVWISLVGKAGIGKTPSAENILRPLNKANKNEVKKFMKKQKDFLKYNALSKEEKKTAFKVEEPVKRQFIVGDITIEALIDIHNDNQNSVGIFKDELAGWLKDMNKYRAGSDLEHWLSSWSNQAILLNRKTAKSNYIDAAFFLFSVVFSQVY